MPFFGKKWKCAVCGETHPASAKFCDKCGTQRKEYRDRYDLFMSYRRDGGGEVATIIQLALEKFKKSVFLDVMELQVGRFDERILEVIEQSDAFVLVMSEGCLDRCVNKSDWLKREIVHAISLDKRVIPIHLPKFSFPDEEKLSLLPDEMRVLPNLQAVAWDAANVDTTVRRILDAMVSPQWRPSREVKTKADANKKPKTDGIEAIEPVPPKPAAPTPRQGEVQAEDIDFVRELLKRIQYGGEEPTVGVVEQALATLSHDQSIRSIPAICQELLNNSVKKDRFKCLYLLSHLEKMAESSAFESLLFDTRIAFIARGLFSDPSRQDESMSYPESSVVRIAKGACQRQPISADTKVERILRALPDAAPRGVNPLFELLKEVVPPSLRQRVCVQLSRYIMLGPHMVAAAADLFKTYDYYEARPLLVEALPKARPGSRAWMSVTRVLTQWKVTDVQNGILQTLGETDDEETIKACLDYIEIVCTKKRISELTRIASDASPEKARHIRRSLERQGHVESEEKVDLSSVTHIRHPLGPEPLKYWMHLAADMLSLSATDRFGLIYDGEGAELPVSVFVDDPQGRKATIPLKLSKGDCCWLDLELSRIHQAGKVNARAIIELMVTAGEVRTGDSLITTGIGAQRLLQEQSTAARRSR